MALPDIDRLKHTEEYLKQIIDNMPVSLLVLDGELKVLLANSTFCSEFHVSQTDTVGRHFYRLEIPGTSSCSGVRPLPQKSATFGWLRIMSGITSVTQSNRA